MPDLNTVVSVVRLEVEDAGASQKLIAFGRAGQTAAAELEQSGTEMSSAFGRIEGAVTRLEDAITRAAQGIESGMATLKGGFTGLEQAVSALDAKLGGAAGGMSRFDAELHGLAESATAARVELRSTAEEATVLGNQLAKVTGSVTDLGRGLEDSANGAKHVGESARIASPEVAALGRDLDASANGARATGSEARLASGEIEGIGNASVRAAALTKASMSEAEKSVRDFMKEYDLGRTLSSGLAAYEKESSVTWRAIEKEEASVLSEMAAGLRTYETEQESITKQITSSWTAEWKSADAEVLAAQRTANQAMIDADRLTGRTRLEIARQQAADQAAAARTAAAEGTAAQDRPGLGARMRTGSERLSRSATSGMMVGGGTLALAGGSLWEAAKMQGYSQSTVGNTNMSVTMHLAMDDEVTKLMRAGPESYKQLYDEFRRIISIEPKGTSVADIDRIVEAAWKSAVGSGGNAATIGNALASRMNTFGVAPSGAGRMTDLLHSVGAYGNLTVEDLSKYSQRSSVFAHELGVSVPQWGGLFDVLTKQLGPTRSDADLSQLFQHIFHPAVGAKAKVAAMGKDIGMPGLSAEWSASGVHQFGIFKVLDDMNSAVREFTAKHGKKSLGAYQDVIGDFIPGTRGLLSMDILRQRMPEAKQLTTQQFGGTLGAGGPTLGVGGDVNGITQKLFDQMEATLKAKLGIMKNDVVLFAKDVGTALTPMATAAASEVEPLLAKFGEFTQKSPQLVQDLTKIGLAVGGIGLGMKGWAMGLALGPEGAGLAALAAAFLLAYQHSSAFHKEVDSLASGALKAFQGALPSIQSGLTNIGTFLQGTLLSALHTLGVEFDAVKNVALAVSAPFKAFAESLGLTAKNGQDAKNVFSGWGGKLAEFAGILTALVITFKAVELTITVVTSLTKAWTIAQAALDFVLDANPIALIVVALAGLVIGFKFAYDNCKPLREALSALGDKIKEIPGILGHLKDEGLAKFDEFQRSAFVLMQSLGTNIVALFTGLPGRLGSAIGGIVGSIIAGFVHLADQLVGHSIVPDMLNAIVKFFTDLPGKLVAALAALVTGVLASFTGLAKDVLGKLGDLGTSIASWFGGEAGKFATFGGTLMTKLASGITSGANGVKDAITSAVTGALGTAGNLLGQAGNAINGTGGSGPGAYGGLFGAGQMTSKSVESGNYAMFRANGIPFSGTLTDYDYAAAMGTPVRLPGGRGVHYSYQGSETQSGMGTAAFFGTPNGGNIALNHLQGPPGFAPGQTVSGGSLVGLSGAPTNPKFGSGAHLCLVTDTKGNTFLAMLTDDQVNQALSVGTELDTQGLSPAKPYASDLSQAARITGLPLNVLSSVLVQESSGNRNVPATRGADGLDIGLMQVGPAEAKIAQQYAPDASYSTNPHQNIMAGAGYLAYLYNGPAKKNLYTAVQMYNAGAAGAAKGYGTSYANQVMARAGYAHGGGDVGTTPTSAQASAIDSAMAIPYFGSPSGYGTASRMASASTRYPDYPGFAGAQAGWAQFGQSGLQGLLDQVNQLPASMRAKFISGSGGLNDIANRWEQIGVTFNRDAATEFTRHETALTNIHDNANHRLSVVQERYTGQMDTILGRSSIDTKAAAEREALNYATTAAKAHGGYYSQHTVRGRMVPAHWLAGHGPTTSETTTMIGGIAVHGTKTTPGTKGHTVAAHWLPAHQVETYHAPLNEDAELSKLQQEYGISRAQAQKLLNVSVGAAKRNEAVGIGNVLYSEQQQTGKENTRYAADMKKYEKTATDSMNTLDSIVKAFVKGVATALDPQKIWQGLQSGFTKQINQTTYGAALDVYSGLHAKTIPLTAAQKRQNQLYREYGSSSDTPALIHPGTQSTSQQLTDLLKGAVGPTEKLQKMDWAMGMVNERLGEMTGDLATANTGLEAQSKYDQEQAVRQMEQGQAVSARWINGMVDAANKEENNTTLLARLSAQVDLAGGRFSDFGKQLDTLKTALSDKFFAALAAGQGAIGRYVTGLASLADQQEIAQTAQEGLNLLVATTRDDLGGMATAVKNISAAATGDWLHAFATGGGVMNQYTAQLQLAYSAQLALTTAQHEQDVILGKVTGDYKTFSTGLQALLSDTLDGVKAFGAGIDSVSTDSLPSLQAKATSAADALGSLPDIVKGLGDVLTTVTDAAQSDFARTGSFSGGDIMAVQQARLADTQANWTQANANLQLSLQTQDLQGAYAALGDEIKLQQDEVQKAALAYGTGSQQYRQQLSTLNDLNGQQTELKDAVTLTSGGFVSMEKALKEDNDQIIDAARLHGTSSTEYKSAVDKFNEDAQSYNQSVASAKAGLALFTGGMTEAVSVATAMSTRFADTANHAGDLSTALGTAKSSSDALAQSALTEVSALGSLYSATSNLVGAFLGAASSIMSVGQNIIATGEKMIADARSAGTPADQAASTLAGHSPTYMNGQLVGGSLSGAGSIGGTSVASYVARHFGDQLGLPSVTGMGTVLPAPATAQVLTGAGLGTTQNPLTTGESSPILYGNNATVNLVDASGVGTGVVPGGGFFGGNLDTSGLQGLMGQATGGGDTSSANDTTIPMLTAPGLAGLDSSNAQIGSDVSSGQTIPYQSGGTLDSTATSARTKAGKNPLTQLLDAIKRGASRSGKTASHGGKAHSYKNVGGKAVEVNLDSVLLDDGATSIDIGLSGIFDLGGPGLTVAVSDIGTAVTALATATTSTTAPTWPALLMAGYSGQAANQIFNYDPAAGAAYMTTGGQNPNLPTAIGMPTNNGYVDGYPAGAPNPWAQGGGLGYVGPTSSLAAIDPVLAQAWSDWQANRPITGAERGALDDWTNMQRRLQGLPQQYDPYNPVQSGNLGQFGGAYWGSDWGNMYGIAADIGAGRPLTTADQDTLYAHGLAQIPLFNPAQFPNGYQPPIWKGFDGQIHVSNWDALTPAQRQTYELSVQGGPGMAAAIAAAPVSNPYGQQQALIQAGVRGIQSYWWLKDQPTQAQLLGQQQLIAGQAMRNAGGATNPYLQQIAAATAATATATAATAANTVGGLTADQGQEIVSWLRQLFALNTNDTYRSGAVGSGTDFRAWVNQLGIAGIGMAAAPLTN